MLVMMSYASPFGDAVVKSYSTNPASRSGVSTSILVCRSVGIDSVRSFSSYLLCSPKDTD